MADDTEITIAKIDSGEANLDSLLARKYVPTVSLSENWKTARDVTGDESSFHFTGDQPKPAEPSEEELKGKLAAAPANTTYAVNPGGIRDAEGTILSSLGEEVTAYETFKKDALGKVQWIFLTDNERGLDHKENENPSNSMFQSNGPTDVTIKDPNPALTTALVYNLEQILKTCGDVLQQTGDFAAMLNNAAQYYAQADKAPFRSDDES